MTVLPTICSMSERFSSALPRTTPSTACTTAKPRMARIQGRAHVGSVPNELIEATP